MILYLVPDIEFILDYFCIHRNPFYNTHLSAVWVEKWAHETRWDTIESLFQEEGRTSEMSYWRRSD